MTGLTDIFVHFCGQASCLLAGGEVLPVCQRCLGLYVAAAITGVWLAASGIWRRGLPSWSVFLAQEAVLLAAMLGGVHAWGASAGPAWKIACGLWTGHVLTIWLIGGAGHLWRLSRPWPPAQQPWRRQDKLQGLAAPLLLTGLAVAIPHAMPLGWFAWSAMVVLGAAVLLASLAAAAFASAALLAGRIRENRRQEEGGCGITGLRD